MSRRIALVASAALVFAGCGGDDGGGGGSADGGSGGVGEDGNDNLEQEEVADRFLSVLLADGGARFIDDEPCPMSIQGDPALYNVQSTTFPSHVMSDSPLEFRLVSSFGQGPDAPFEIVVCVDGASGYITIDTGVVEGEPEMDNPLDIKANGSTGSGAGIIGETLAVNVGIIDGAGVAGEFVTTVAQVCNEDGSGCEQRCADPIAPTQVTDFSAGAEPVCNPGDADAEDGSFATLGRVGQNNLIDPGMDGIAASNSCILADFPSTSPASVRVVASWVRDPVCGAATCMGADCGEGHAYGVWVTSDGGASFQHVGIANGSETTQAGGANATEPNPPLVGEHFNPMGAAIDGVLVCRSGFASEDDHLAVDVIELCPP